MVSQHIALAALVTPIGFYMDGSAAQTLHGLGQCLIETILHGADLHVLQWGDKLIHMLAHCQHNEKRRGNSNAIYMLNLKADFLTESHARDNTFEMKNRCIKELASYA